MLSERRPPQAFKQERSRSYHSRWLIFWTINALWSEIRAFIATKQPWWLPLRSPMVMGFRCVLKLMTSLLFCFADQHSRWVNRFKLITSHPHFATLLYSCWSCLNREIFIFFFKHFNIWKPYTATRDKTRTLVLKTFTVLATQTTHTYSKYYSSFAGI